MPEQREMTTCSSLSVTVSNMRWPVTEGVLHQVFDAYGAGNKITMMERSTYVWAFVEFRSWQEAAQARHALHGRCIYDGCAYLDVQHAWPAIHPATSTTWACSEVPPPTTTPTLCPTLGCNVNVGNNHFVVVSPTCGNTQAAGRVLGEPSLDRPPQPGVALKLSMLTPTTHSTNCSLDNIDMQKYAALQATTPGLSMTDVSLDDTVLSCMPPVITLPVGSDTCTTTQTLDGMVADEGFTTIGGLSLFPDLCVAAAVEVEKTLPKDMASDEELAETVITHVRDRSLFIEHAMATGHEFQVQDSCYVDNPFDHGVGLTKLLGSTRCTQDLNIIGSWFACLVLNRKPFARNTTSYSMHNLLRDSVVWEDNKSVVLAIEPYVQWDPGIMRILMHAMSDVGKLSGTLRQLLNPITGNPCSHGYVKKEKLLYNSGYRSCVEGDINANELEHAFNISKLQQFFSKEGLFGLQPHAETCASRCNLCVISRSRKDAKAMQLATDHFLNKMPSWRRSGFSPGYYLQPHLGIAPSSSREIFRSTVSPIDMIQKLYLGNTIQMYEGSVCTVANQHNLHVNSQYTVQLNGHLLLWYRCLIFFQLGSTSLHMFQEVKASRQMYWPWYPGIWSIISEGVTMLIAQEETVTRRRASMLESSLHDTAADLSFVCVIWQHQIGQWNSFFWKEMIHRNQQEAGSGCYVNL